MERMKSGAAAYICSVADAGMKAKGDGNRHHGEIEASKLCKPKGSSNGE